MENPYDYKRFAILYVDDEEKALKQLSRAIGDTFRLLTAPNAEEGLRLLNEHLDEIGIVMSDQLISALAEIVGPADKVRRVVIDIQAQQVPIIHVERFGDEQLLDVFRALDGVHIRTVAPVQSTPEGAA